MIIEKTGRDRETRGQIQTCHPNRDWDAMDDAILLCERPSINAEQRRTTTRKFDSATAERTENSIDGVEPRPDLDAFD